MTWRGWIPPRLAWQSAACSSPAWGPPHLMPATGHPRTACSTRNWGAAPPRQPVRHGTRCHLHCRCWARAASGMEGRVRAWCGHIRGYGMSGRLCSACVTLRGTQDAQGCRSALAKLLGAASMRLSHTLVLEGCSFWCAVCSLISGLRARA